MARAERLLALMQLLRRHRHAVGGAHIAAELGISLRTLYRDIAALQAQGARIDGAPGLGYLLRPGSTLPPLMLSGDEVEALLLGARWVVEHGDRELAAAARDAMAKIADVLPGERRLRLDSSALIVGPAAGGIDTREVALRRAIRGELKVVFDYRDGAGATTHRTVWPFALGYFDRARVAVAWCELRQAMRHFRTDRMAELVLTDQRYPQRREALAALWREQEGIGSPRRGPAAGNAADRI